MARGAQNAWLAVALLACGAGDEREGPRGSPRDEEASWPGWPRDEAAARALLDEHRVHALSEDAPLTASALIEALDRAARAGTLRAGWRAIAGELRAHRVVVVGVHHDAAEHVRVFGQLFGATGTADGRLWAVELFDADGRWGGVDAASQAGDGAALARFARDGSAEALAALRRTAAEGDYTAWKYGYLDDVLALAVSARGAEQALIGCDVPPGFDERLAPLTESTRLRMRELHCAFALADARRDRPRAPVALLWGDAHLEAEGIARLLPEEPARVHLIGGRRSDAGLEPELAARLALSDPVLVPLARRRFALILPDARLRAESDRSRERLGIAEPHVRASATAACVLSVAGRRVSLEAEREEALPLPVGHHAFVVAHGERRIAGALAIEPGGSVELHIDPPSRRVDVRLASEADAPPGSL